MSKRENILTCDSIGAEHGVIDPVEGKIVIQVKRVYEPPECGDAVCFLVDRLWPRGIKKESLPLTAWLKDVAPSDGLRRWFGHDPAKWEEFQQRYRLELAANPAALRPILQAAVQGNVILLYGAHDTEHNNAVTLKAYLDACLDDPVCRHDSMPSGEKRLH